MANNGIVIFAPIGINDIQTVLGTSSSDLGTLCKHSNINKWAKYKPIIHSELGEITEAQRKTANQGFTPKKFVIPSDFLATSVPEVSEWNYNTPTGGANSPYRISDFIRVSSPTNPGYNNNAKAPTSGFNDYEVISNQIKAGLKYSFTMKLGDASYEGNGNTTGIEIPINQLTLINGSPINDGTWRIGIAMYKLNSNNKYDIAIFAGKNAIPTTFDSSTFGNILPDIGTNTRCIEWLKSTETSKVPIECIAFLSKGLLVNSNGTVSVTNSNHFFMPSGGRFKMLALNVVDAIKGNIEKAEMSYVGNNNYTYRITYTNPGTPQPYYNLVQPKSVGATRDCNIEVVFNITNAPPLIQASSIKASFWGTQATSATLYEFDAITNSWKQVSSSTYITPGKYKIIGSDSGNIIPFINQDKFLDNGSSMTQYNIAITGSFTITGTNSVKSFSLSNIVRIRKAS